MTLKVCKRGHVIDDGNRRANGGCKLCQKLHNQSEKGRLTRSKRIRNGTIRCGHTKNVLVNVGEEKLRQAFAVVRETGSHKALYEMITPGRWWAIRYFYPKIGKQMDKIIADAKAARRPEIITPAKPAIIRATNLELVGRIGNAVSRYLSRDHRDDVIGDMVEAVLSGKLKPGNIEKEVPKFVRARFRTDHNQFGDLSLDVPIWTDSETNLFDIIPDEQALWR